jgi:acetylglutamate kinase
MKTVIKFAGTLLEDDATIRSLARQVAALALEGHEILVVHGGGRAFTEALKRMGIESKIVPASVTDRETRDAAVMVFAGLLNKRLAAAISAEGYPAIGVSAADAQCFLAEPMSHGEIPGSLGFVGYLTGMNNAFIESLWRERLIPVAPCLGLGPDNELYNIRRSHGAACANFSVPTG